MRKVDIALITLIVVVLVFDIATSIVQKDFSEALGWTTALLWFIGYIIVKIQLKKEEDKK